jgi:poly(A) polymerase/tRNA nucleotidyltransferase (CCA-adding enzyme)
MNVGAGVPLDAILASALPAGSLYAVGGRVRDELRAAYDGVARPLKDLDYVVVGLALPELLERLQPIGRADVVGAAFAVVKLTVNGTTVDIALPRRERSTGVGHREFAVESGPEIPLEDDLARRDFRMNMIARALPDGDLVDPFDGARDVRERRIEVLNDEAFVEDPLRMLRAAQFAARFEFVVGGRTMAAMREAAPLVTSVSPERVRDELIKLLSAARPSIGLEVLRLGGVLEHVLPEVAEGIGVEQNEWHAYDVYRHNLVTMDATASDDLVLRLAGLLHDVGKPRTKDGPHFYRHELVGEDLVRELLDRLRFPNDLRDRVAGLVRHHMYAADPELEDRTLRRFIQRIGTENLERQFALRAADVAGSGLPRRGDHNERFQARVAALVAERPAISLADLPVDGADVIAAFVAAGKAPAGSRGGPFVGATLRALLERVMDDPSENERERLLARIAELALDS